MVNLKKYIPILEWAPTYKREWLRYDIIAGIVIGAVAVPELIAYAQLAGLPPEYGLYAGLIAPLAYLLFGTLRQASIGPSSAEAALVAAALGAVVIIDPTRYASLAALTAILVGVIALVAYLLKLGFLSNFIANIVVTGFLTGLGLEIIIGQLPKILGIEGGSGNFFEKALYIIQNLNEVHLLTFAIGFLAIIAILLIGRKWPKVPGSLIVVVVAIIGSYFLNWEAKGVLVTGAFPSGLPAIGFPCCLESSDLGIVLPLAVALFILAYSEGLGVGRDIARGNDYRLDANKELLGLSVPSVAVGLFQGFPVAISTSRSILSNQSGAKTTLCGAVSALLILVTLLFLTGVFYYLPEPIIGALIIVAMTHAIKITELHRLFAINKNEFAVAIVTLFGVLLFGILPGLFIGVGLTLLMILYDLSKPHIAVLGRVPGTSQFSDIARRPENEEIPGVLIVRVDAPLIFTNVETVEDTVKEFMEKREETLKLVILDLEASPEIDISGMDYISDLNEDLKKKGMQLRLTGATGAVRDILKAGGHEDILLNIKPGYTVSQMVDEWMQHHEEIKNHEETKIGQQKPEGQS